jgi:predicted amidohydrolase
VRHGGQAWHLAVARQHLRAEGWQDLQHRHGDRPEGSVVARYRKMFPFYPYEVGVTGGHEFCVFDVPDVGRSG